MSRTVLGRLQKLEFHKVQSWDPFFSIFSLTICFTSWVMQMTLLSMLVIPQFILLLASVHQYNTRQSSSNDSFLSKKNTLYGLRSVQYDGAKIWNNILANIRVATFIHSFRKNIKQYFSSPITTKLMFEMLLGYLVVPKCTFMFYPFIPNFFKF